MAEKKVSTRIQSKHDLDKNWRRATNFQPLPGEIIIYEPQVSEEDRTLEDGTILPVIRSPRFKVGDGSTLVSDLPFSDVVVEGEVADSIADGLGSRAIGPNTVALGNQVIAGCRGYYYDAVYFNQTNKTVTFCLCNTQVTNSSEISILSSLNEVTADDRPVCDWATSVVIDEETGATAPLHVSYANDDKQYNFEFEIDAQKPYLVTIKSKDGKIPFSSIMTLTTEEMTMDDFAIFSAEQPLIGAASLKWASFATGSSVATGSNSFASGTAHAYGDLSHAEGWGTITYHHGAHAEGRATIAYGNSSHVEGNKTEAHNHYGHAEGDQTISKGNASHAEGLKTRASKTAAHAEGGSSSNSANTFTWDDDVSHVDKLQEGESETTYQTTDGKTQYTHVRTLQGAASEYAHTEGYDTTALGAAAHAEGNGSIARGKYSHAEGVHTQANSDGSHAEGNNTLAIGNSAHAEGKGTEARVAYSHAEGDGSKAYSYYAHAEGNKTIAGNAAKESDGRGAHAEGIRTQATRSGTHAEGFETKATSNYAHAEGKYTKAAGAQAHAEGEHSSLDAITISWKDDDIHFGSSIANSDSSETLQDNGKYTHTRPLVGATGQASHTEGLDTSAKGKASHAEGQQTIARGVGDHTEGVKTQTDGGASHAEGFNTYAKGYVSHAEGKGTLASGSYSHAEGDGTKATNYYAHAEGYKTEASGRGSHAEGQYSKAIGVASHSEGLGTLANGDSQHVQGKYNISSNTYAHIIGNGSSDSARSNAHTVDWNGNAWFAGEIKVGGSSYNSSTAVSVALIDKNSTLTDGHFVAWNASSKKLVDGGIVQADWTQTDSTKSGYIKNKPYDTQGVPVFTWVANNQLNMTQIGNPELVVQDGTLKLINNGPLGVNIENNVLKLTNNYTPFTCEIMNNVLFLK